MERFSVSNRLIRGKTEDKIGWGALCKRFFRGPWRRGDAVRSVDSGRWRELGFRIVIR